MARGGTVPVKRFRRKDSNLRSRIQSPLPYHLATPERERPRLKHTARPTHVTWRVRRPLDQVMRTVLAALGLLIVTAACGAYSFPGSTPQTGTVHGTVRVFPCAPVEQQGQICKGLMGRGLELTFTNGGTSTSTTVDANGNYSITLPAATYKVSVKGIARIISGPNPVTVAAGASVEADYQVDSGIRAPGPPAAVS